MSGLKILHVSPRLTGSLKTWSGREQNSGRSWLVDHGKEMGFNAIWFSPFFQTTQIPVIRDGKTVTGSVYAIKDHFTLDPDFSSGLGTEDDAHLRHFTSYAAKEGLLVMGDMVFNHVARDNPLVDAEDKAIKAVLEKATAAQPLWKNNTVIGMRYDTSAKKDNRLYFKFERDAGFDLITPGTHEESWEDVAQINYNSPEAESFFVTGQKGKDGFWKQVLDWHIDRGFTGFRCDVAYKVPPRVWSELIQHAHDRLPGVVFMAETLGDNGEANRLKDAEIKVNGKPQKAFDLAMLGTYWWNMKDDWLIHENKRMQAISRFGGATFPDNHDTANTVAGHFLDQFAAVADPKKRNRMVSDICLRNYAVAALISNSVYMQLGYEFCRKPVSVFRDPALPAYWNKLQAERGDPNHPLNLTRRIKAINDFKTSLQQAHAITELHDVNYAAPGLLKLSCALRHYKSGAALGRLVIFVNEKPETGAIKIHETALPDNDKKTLHRLVLGAGDTDQQHFYEINDIAAFYTPLSQMPHNRPGGAGPTPHSPKL